MAAGQGLGPAGGRAGRDSPGDAGTLTGAAWLAALPVELAGQRHVMAGLAGRCRAWALARSLLVGCSLGRVARASAEVLATASAAAALRHPADLPTAMAAYVTGALSL